MCDQQSLRSAYAYAQSDQSLCKSLEYSMRVKLLTEHKLEVLSLKGGCTGSSESTLVKMQNCWKAHVVAQLCLHQRYYFLPSLFSGFQHTSLYQAPLYLNPCPLVLSQFYHYVRVIGTHHFLPVRCSIFPSFFRVLMTMWYVRPAKPQISLRIRAV